jgi:hypothetical protein
LETLFQSAKPSNPYAPQGDNLRLLVHTSKCPADVNRIKVHFGTDMFPVNRSSATEPNATGCYRRCRLALASHTYAKHCYKLSLSTRSGFMEDRFDPVASCLAASASECPSANRSQNAISARFSLYCRQMPTRRRSRTRAPKSRIKTRIIDRTGKSLQSPAWPEVAQAKSAS